MTHRDFIHWLLGFADAVEGAPTETQWARVVEAAKAVHEAGSAHVQSSLGVTTYTPHVDGRPFTNWGQTGQMAGVIHSQSCKNGGAG